MLSYDLLGLPSSAHCLNTQFFTSWLLPAPVLAGLRAVMSVYAFTTIFYSFGWFAHNIDIFHLKDVNLPEITFSLGASAIAKSFSYFTYLSYWGLAFYFAISSIHTLMFHLTGRTYLSRWPRWLQISHSVFYSSIVCFPPMVSAIYWSTMFVDKWYTLEFDRWSNLSIHCLNTVFALTEMILPRTNLPPWTHLFILMGFMSLYLGLVYISKAVEDFYPYLWLDPRVGWKQILAHIIGYTMAIILFFNVVRGIIWLRRNATVPEAEDVVRQDDEIALRATSDLEMAGSKSEWDVSRPQTGISVPDSAYTRSTFDFGFGGGDRFVESSERIPASPRLQRDERGLWTLKYDNQPENPPRR
jgi:hypothetical protein